MKQSAVMALALTAMTFASRIAEAQDTTGSTSTASLRGTVVSARDGSPVEGAVVMLREGARATTTTLVGEFALTGLTPGAYHLTVRKLGFGPLDAIITVSGNTATEAELELEPLGVQRLEDVVVNADAPATGVLLEVTARMRSSAGGIFVLRAQLDSAGGMPLSDVIRRRVRGAQVVLYPSRGRQLIASRRGFGGLIDLPRADPTDAKSPSGCFSQVYLNGIRIYSPSDRGAPAPDLREYSALDLDAIEFYPGAATTPTQYGGEGAVCGTLLLWARSR